VISNKSWNPQFIRAESLANLEIGTIKFRNGLNLLSNVALFLFTPYGSPHLILR
jgi:hypothetical protein